MSHGPSTEGVRADPDLTPMLDIVMQLLMYFIMCANFVGQEVNENIKLPPSQKAMVIDRGEGDLLYMNIDPDGRVLVLGKNPMDMEDTTNWLNDQIKVAPKDDSGKPKTGVVIRADKGASYSSVYALMQLCKNKGFSRFKVRATME